jgi:ribonuclease D
MGTMAMFFTVDLDNACAEPFHAARQIAWDIETSSLDPRKGRIGTVQLHAPGVGNVVVQVDNEAVPRNLVALLEDAEVQKVFHHAMFDLRFMVAHWSARPSNLACTKIASKILNRDASNDVHTLQSLVADYLGVQIDKAQRFTNWLSQELTAAQVEYAIGDVIYLLPLLTELEDRLRRHDLYEIYESCVDFLPTRVALDLGGWPDLFVH